MDDLFEGFSNKFSQTYKQDVRGKRPEFNDVAEFVNAQFSRKDPSPSYDEFEREVLKQAWDHFDKKYNKHVDNAKALDFVESYDQFRGEQSKALKGLYQNTGYGQERQEMQNLVIDVSAKQGISSIDFKLDLEEPLIIDKLSSIYLDNIIMINGTPMNNSLKDTGTNNQHSAFYFVLNINEFNIKTKSNVYNKNSHTGTTAPYSSKINGGFYIPNEIKKHDSAQDTLSVTNLKGKKFNFVSQINPCKLHSISGSISAYGIQRHGAVENTDFKGIENTSNDSDVKEPHPVPVFGTGDIANPVTDTSGRFTAEFLFIAYEKMSWK
jgi:hypothetical protein